VLLNPIECNMIFFVIKYYIHNTGYRDTLKSLTPGIEDVPDNSPTAVGELVNTTVCYTPTTV